MISLDAQGSESRFGSADGKEVTDEIALNPSHFRNRTFEQSLSTLVREMAHLEQHHFEKPSALMKAVTHKAPRRLRNERGPCG